MTLLLRKRAIIARRANRRVRRTRNQMVDPTRTISLRSRFVAEVRRRYRILKKDIVKTIVDRDCFGLQPGLPITNQAAPARAFAWQSTPDKVNLFAEWLEKLQQQVILDPDIRKGTMSPIAATLGRTGLEHSWMDEYLQPAYEKGIEAARKSLLAAGYDPSMVGSLPGPKTMAAIQNPAHRERVALVYGRAFSDLKTVTQQTTAGARRSLSDSLTTGITQGIAAGHNPRRIARDIAKSVTDGVALSQSQAETIARTEVIRAHHLANVNEMRRVDDSMLVDVEAEFVTAGFNVCPKCKGLAAAGPYTLDEIEPLIPAHPRCRCTAKPKIVKQVTGGGAKDTAAILGIPKAATIPVPIVPPKATPPAAKPSGLAGEFPINTTRFDPGKNARTPDNVVGTVKAIKDPADWKAYHGDETTLRKWKKTLDQDKREILNEWGTDRYKAIRDDLADGTADTEAAKLIVETIEGAPKVNGLVYRGLVTKKKSLAVEDDEDFLIALSDRWGKKVGTQLEWKAPASTSVLPSVGGQFSDGVVFEIESKTARAVWGTTPYDNEIEAITMPNSKYEILGVHWAKIKGKQRIIVQMKEL